MPVFPRFLYFMVICLIRHTPNNNYRNASRYGDKGNKSPENEANSGRKTIRIG
jgi:hypothetical protein